MTERVIAVTGGHGVLGKAVVEAALAQGCRIAVIDHASGHAVPDGVLELGGVDLTDPASAKATKTPSPTTNRGAGRKKRSK